MFAMTYHGDDMKVTERMTDFPRKPALKGLQLEAYHILQSADKGKPVAQVALDGQNAPAVKRAFVAAAKVLDGAVEIQNGEHDSILVRWLPRGQTGQRRRGVSLARARVQHSDEAVEAEAKRLWALKGEPADSYHGQDAETKRKLHISAKRNLSRRASA
ncbi:MAG: hypothetical protein ACYDAG_15575 [Chloroflexota bacterium]